MGNDKGWKPSKSANGRITQFPGEGRPGPLARLDAPARYEGMGPRDAPPSFAGWALPA